MTWLTVFIHDRETTDTAAAIPKIAHGRNQWRGRSDEQK
jgi:hypothetical protein